MTCNIEYHPTPANEESICTLTIDGRIVADVTNHPSSCYHYCGGWNELRYWIDVTKASISLRDSLAYIVECIDNMLRRWWGVDKSAYRKYNILQDDIVIHEFTFGTTHPSLPKIEDVAVEEKVVTEDKGPEMQILHIPLPPYTAPEKIVAPIDAAEEVNTEHVYIEVDILSRHPSMYDLLSLLASNGVNTYIHSMKDYNTAFVDEKYVKWEILSGDTAKSLIPTDLGEDNGLSYFNMKGKCMWNVTNSIGLTTINEVLTLHGLNIFDGKRYLFIEKGGIVVDKPVQTKPVEQLKESTVYVEIDLSLFRSMSTLMKLMDSQGAKTTIHGMYPYNNSLISAKLIEWKAIAGCPKDSLVPTTLGSSCGLAQFNLKDGTYMFNVTNATALETLNTVFTDHNLNLFDGVRYLFVEKGSMQGELPL